MMPNWTKSVTMTPQSPDVAANATLSTAQQDDYYWLALSQTEAFRDRRSVLRARSLEAVEVIADMSLDFVFLDADHSREAVVEDLRGWAPKIALGGLLCGHDYGHPLFPGVKDAVDAFVASTGGRVECGQDYTWFMRMDAPC